MKTLIPLLTALFLIQTAHSEVVIYNQSYTQKQTGLGRTLSTRFTGYFLFDDAGNYIQIDVSPRDGTFTSYVYTGTSVRYLRASMNGTALVLSIPMGDTTGGGVFLKGRGMTVDTGTSYFDAAKVLTLSGMAIFGSDPDAEVYEFKGSMTYNRTASVGANMAGNDINVTAAGLKASLAARGYTEIR